MGDRVSMSPCSTVSKMVFGFPLDKVIDYLFASDGSKPSKEARAIARVDAVADAMLEGCEDDPETS